MGSAEMYRSGDYRVVADRLRPAAEWLVEWCAPGPGDLVLDVAAGTGNVTAFVAGRGARVVALDLIVEQLRLGAETYERPDVALVAADAMRLPVRDAAADMVLSTFGIMYADDGPLALDEAARATRTNGLLGLTTWAASGFQFAARTAMDRYSPDPLWTTMAGWGDPTVVADRLATVCDDVEVEIREMRMTLPSVEVYWELTSANAPPLVALRETLAPAQFADLGKDMREAARATGEESAGSFVLVDTYLAARGRVR